MGGCVFTGPLGPPTAVSCWSGEEGRGRGVERVAERVLLVVPAAGCLLPSPLQASAGNAHLSAKPVNPSAGVSYRILHARHHGEEWCIRILNDLASLRRDGYMRRTRVG